MVRIKTPHFSLDAYIKGDKNARSAVLVLPGFLDSKDYAHLKTIVDRMAERGFYALSIDMPGTWGSSEDTAAYTYTNCLQAATEVVEKIGKPTILVGHSNGGRLALQIASKNPAVVAVVAIMSPLYIRRSTSKKDSVIKWKKEGVRHYQMPLPDDPDKSASFSIPFSFLEDSQKYPPKPLLSKIFVPKLFIAGSEDHVVTLKEVQKAYDAAAEPKRFELVNAPHVYRENVAAVDEVNDIVDSFVDGLRLS